MPAAVPLVDEDQIVQRLGRDLSTSESDRLEALLIDASAAVRNYTGRTFGLADHVLRTRVRDGKLRLPQRPVVEITSVKAMNLDGTVGATLGGWMFDGIDELLLASTVTVIVLNASWPGGARPAVEIAYRAGYEEIPDDVVAVTCSIILRALGLSPLEGGLSAESIDGYSYSRGSAGAAGPLGMLPDERATLDLYRLPGGPILQSR